MAVHNAVTLLKKSDAALGMMVRHFCQSALADGVVLDSAVRAEVVQLQVDIKAQVKHIEETGQLQQPPHKKGDERAPKGSRHGKGKGGGMSTAEAKKMRADRVAKEKCENSKICSGFVVDGKPEEEKPEKRVTPGFYKEPDDDPKDQII